MLLMLQLPLLIMLHNGPEDVLQHVPDMPLPPSQTASTSPNSSSSEAVQAGQLSSGAAAETTTSKATNRGTAAAAAAAAVNGSAKGSADCISTDTSCALMCSQGKVERQEQPMQILGKHTVQAQEAQEAKSSQQQQQEQQHEQWHEQQQQQGMSGRRGVMAIAAIITLLLCGGWLLFLSDLLLQQHPSSQCLSSLASWTKAAFHGQQQQHGLRQLQQDEHLAGSCWLMRVTQFTVLLQDFTPTLGLFWYFFTELFEEFRPFFLFVFNSFSVVLAVPCAIRFPNRPLLLTWLQLYISCMFKPYACVGDMVPWMALLPLLQQQLQCLKVPMFLLNSFLLLVVLGPAMWHQWIVVDAANANFFYSITLLLGVWYTVFVVQLLRLTALLDRRLAGKPTYPMLSTG
jgi:hypothetical protein